MQLLGTGANTLAERTQQSTLYADAKMSLLADMAAWLGKETALAPRQQARDAAAFLTHSQPQHDKIAVHVRLSEIFNELTRRASPTLAGQLELHFNLLWRSVWPILRWAFPTTTTGVEEWGLRGGFSGTALHLCELLEDGGPLNRAHHRHQPRHREGQR